MEREAAIELFVFDWPQNLKMRPTFRIRENQTNCNSALYAIQVVFVSGGIEG